MDKHLKEFINRLVKHLIYVLNSHNLVIIVILKNRYQYLMNNIENM